MITLITNKIYITQPSQEVLDYAETLYVDNPNYFVAQKIGSYRAKYIPRQLCLYEKKGEALVFPFGTLPHLWNEIKKYPYSIDFNPLEPSKLRGSINLYDYQREAVESLKRAKSGVLQAPCGSGKTQIGLALIRELGGKALWLTHTHDLMNQSLERCKKYFHGDFGTITEGKVDIGGDITFATVQTMTKLDPRIYENEFAVVVCDECHRVSGTPTLVKQFYSVISNIKARYKYGLSATLTRADGLIKTLYALIGDIVHVIPKSAVGDKIIKAEHIEVDIPLEYNILDYSSPDGMIDQVKLISMLSENRERTKAIVVNIVRNVGRRQLVLCHRVKMCEDIVNMLKAENIRASLVTGKTDKDKRNFNAEVIVATYALAKEGLDVPSLEVLHLATPQKNKSTTEQSVGRIERNIEGKKKPICYDYVDIDIPYCVSAFKKRKNILRKN